MKVISLLLVLFLSIGFFARKYNTWVRLLLIASIAVIVLYESLH
ncbi:MAG TPA: hypothetical protein VFV38_49525 [Ktedonobacteraceae bacterium]|nr:hypothetical protein [Ktedonobacteraceae bacterium]